MKTKMKLFWSAILLPIAVTMFATVVFSQVPDKMTYQAVVRDPDNNLVVNTGVGVRISIIQSTPEGTSVFVETHSPETNANGLMTFEIGNGEIVSGNLATIDWADGPYFLKTETDPNGGNTYTITGTSELLSVPYAFHAHTAQSLTTPIEEVDPLFSASPASGITQQNIVYWNDKLDDYTETDPLFFVSVAASITSEDTIYWNSKLDDYTETDPVWLSEKEGYYTKTELQNPGEAEVSWTNITDHPTTLSGYAITDAAYSDHTHELATPTSDGFMSASDKETLDNLVLSDYVAGPGIQIEGNEISADLSLRASSIGDTLVLSPGNHVFIPGLSDANAELPVVSTGQVTNITAHKAYGHGEVVFYGEAVLTEIGVCWGENLNPTPEDNFSSAGATNGHFVVVMQNLAENTVYFVRAFAKTADQTFYGQNVIFTTTDIIPVPAITTTEVSGITETTALSGGFIASDGGSPVTARGVCWNTSPAPTIDNFKTTNGSGTGLFTSYITGLTLNTTYYIRGYATNANGTNYGPELIFKTAGVLPTVTTNVPQNVTTHRAILGGEVSAQGSAAITERGICFGSSPNPVTSGNKIVLGSGTGSFSTVDANLIPNSTFYVRAYATNSVGTAYGANQTLTTLNAYYEGFENGFPGGTTGGWGIVSSKSYEGFYSLHTTQGGAEAAITLTFAQAGEVAFFLNTFKHEFSNNNGSVSFYINDILMGTIQTGNQWLNYSFIFPAGTNTYKWIFNSSSYNGAWLDYIIMPE